MSGETPFHGHRQVGMAGPAKRRYRAGMTTRPNPMHVGYRFPAEVISYAVYLYSAFR